MRCTCGEPETLGVVHFRTRPCFHYVEREWVGLTDQETNDALVEADPMETLSDYWAKELAKEVEKRLKDKNT